MKNRIVEHQVHRKHNRLSGKSGLMSRNLIILRILFFSSSLVGNFHFDYQKSAMNQ